ncbi:MAG TPA: hypothetical protein VGL19_14310, partial [Polyangiaceae bacterium]
MVWVFLQIARRQLHFFDRDHDAAGAFSHGFGRVRDQVHDHLADLRRVGLDRFDAVLNLVVKDDVRRDHTAQKPRHFASGGGQIQSLQLEFALPGVVEHLAGELRRATGTELDFLEQRQRDGVRVQHVFGQR